MQAHVINPTPIHELSCREAAELGIRLFVKRDDLIPYCLGGNKVRIALEVMDDLRSRGNDALIMYGDPRSNLCRVLALLCREGDVPCLMVSRPSERSSAPSTNELIVRSLGVEILECGDGKVADGVDEAFARLRSRGLNPYYVYGDRTGSGNEGVLARAYARAYDEICEQEQSSGRHFDLIVVPYGTGSTQAGVVCGSLRRGDGRLIVGISISSRPPERALGVLDQSVRAWHELQGVPLPLDYSDHLHLECGYTCGGYGARSERVDELMARELLEDSLPLDPTYTGKALRGCLDYLRKSGCANKTVLFLHTGGTPLFYDNIGALGTCLLS